MKLAIITFVITSMGVSSHSLSEEKNEVETLTEVSIIGNAELPNKTFDLPWRLASVEKREEQSPPKKLTGMLMPLEPRRYRQQINFSRFLQVDTTHFSAR